MFAASLHTTIAFAYVPSILTVCQYSTTEYIFWWMNNAHIKTVINYTNEIHIYNILDLDEYETQQLIK